MSVATRSAAYPAGMDRKLRAIRQRRMLLAIVRAGLLTLFALLTSMLAAIGIDWWFTLFDMTARATLTVVALGTAAATLFLCGIRPLRWALELSRAARNADQEVPALEERWTTVSHFAETDQAPQSPLAKAMLRQVTSEAVAIGDLVRPAQVARPGGLQRPAMMFVIAGLAFGIFLAANWRQNFVLLQRFWLPLADISATQLESVTGDAVIPRGQPVDVRLKMSGLPRESAVIAVLSESGETDSITLVPNAKQPGVFVYHLPNLKQSFRYQATAGDGRTEWHSITAVDRPSSGEVRFTITPPEYVGLPNYEKAYLPDRARAIQGSQLSIAFRPQTPLKRFELLVARSEATDEDAKPASLLLTADKSGCYRFETPLDENIRLRPLLLSRHNLTNDDRQECAISVVPDRAPVARVVSPTEEMTVGAEETVEIQFEANDDHGVARAELVVYDSSPEKRGQRPEVLAVQEIPLGDQHLAKRVAGTVQLDLAKLGVREGANLSYAIRVADNRVAEPELALVDPESEAMMAEPADEATAETKDAANQAPAGESQADVANSDETSEGAPSKGEPDKTMPEASQATQVATNAEQAVDRAGGDPKAEVSEANRDPKASTEVATGERKVADVKTSVAKESAAENPTEIPASNEEPPASAVKELAAVAAPQGDPNESPAPALKDAKAPDSPDAAANPAKEATTTSPAGNSEIAPPAGPDQQPTATGNEADKSDRPTPEGTPGSDNRRVAKNDDKEGQSGESNRLRLKIARTLASTDEEQRPPPEDIKIKIRERLAQIDAQLKPAEAALQGLSDSLKQTGIADPQIQELTRADERLAASERIIADLRSESKDTPLAFAGLQMVEIGSSQIAPARDRVFTVIRQPDVDPSGNVTEGLHRVSRARELLAELLARYQRVLREQQLAKSLEEAAKMYEVYVANMHRLLRGQTRPSGNGLQRKMEVIEVDQDYLDRLRQVIEMRRDLMAEFGRMLADDPRLRGKYMDLLKRRQNSLRDQLTELHERQETIATELTGWQQANEEQRQDIWMLAVELRLQDAAPIARDASQLEERTVSQFPLALDTSLPAPAAAIAHAKRLAVQARSLTSKSRRLLRDPLDDADLEADFDELVFVLSELDAALEQLDFENDDDETGEFAVNRLADTRSLAERVAGWAETAAHIREQRYHGLAKVDQQQLADRTELLRVAMLDAGTELNGQFQNNVPEAIQALVRDLQQVMEAITFNQAAATFSFEGAELESAEGQQAMALRGFELAEELFDQMRRAVIKELDERKPENPNVADLQDPTLNQLLERLEREPNLSALLGLGQRPRNLRVATDWIEFQETAGGMNDDAEEAVRRAKERAEEEKRMVKKERETDKKDTDLSDEEWKKVANAEEAQALLEKKIEELKRKAADPNTDAAETEKLQQMAQQLKALKEQLGGQQAKTQDWQEIVRSDQMKAMMRAIAAGEPLPDTQWNHILSSLDSGLWQVRRKTPPEEYRRAIEQYQERIRRLTSLETDDAANE